MRRSTYIVATLLTGLVLMLIRCKDPFEPEVNNTGINLLVVEGFMAGGGERTNISLSRTADIDGVGFRLESGARVTVEGESGESYPLFENSSGTYSNVLDLRVGRKYRLLINTSSGGSYASDYVPLKNTPMIDNIDWEEGSDGVTIGVSTHDTENATRYYRWRYEQTWEFHSIDYTPYDFVDEKMVDRKNFEKLFTCWQNENSTSIFVTTSASLSQDKISKFRLVNVPRGSWKLSVLYSILVKQYAMTVEEYNYWLKIRKNTEDLGSIFDPQPSDIPGNIKCISDPQEHVIGFVGACIPQQKRIFISAKDIKSWYYQQNCVMFDVPDNKDSLISAFGSNVAEPIAREIRGQGEVRWTGASSVCLDCTLRGTNIKPSFWP